MQAVPDFPQHSSKEQIVDDPMPLVVENRRCGPDQSQKRMTEHIVEQIVDVCRRSLNGHGAMLVFFQQ